MLFLTDANTCLLFNLIRLARNIFLLCGFYYMYHYVCWHFFFTLFHFFHLNFIGSCNKRFPYDVAWHAVCGICSQKRLKIKPKLKRKMMHYWNYIGYFDNSITSKSRIQLRTPYMQFGVRERKNEKSSTYRISKITSTINNFNLLCRRTWCNRTNLIYNVVFTRYFLALHRYGEWILANPCNLCIFHILKRTLTWIAVSISLLALASVCFDQKLCFKNHQNPSVLDQANRATRIMIINCGFSFFF